MIKTLSIDQFVIIEESTLELKEGMTIFTGETGAGKSIILSAMELVVGGDFSPKSIRQGQEQSTFEAVFTPPQDHRVWKILFKNDLVEPGDKEFTVKRIIKQTEETDIWFNGKEISQELLAEIGDELIEIHGQYANHSLLGPENQLNLLDSCGEFPQEFFDNVRDALREVHRLEKELEDEKNFLLKNKQHLVEIEGVVNKFNEIEMREGFLEEAQEEYSKLLIAKETSEALQSILGRLIAGNGVVVNLSAINASIENQDNLEEDVVEELKRLLATALTDLRGAVKEIGTISPKYEIDTEPLKYYGDVLAVLESISDDNEIEFDNLYGFFVEMSDKLARIRNGKERVKEIDQQLADAQHNYREHAHVLTEKRIEAGKKLSTDITNELVPLKLKRAEFEVVVEEKPHETWTERGFNEITFTARMNPGMPFSPISETASGGERARMILAVKVVLQRVQRTPTLVFDEVDTGIGGSAAAALGERVSSMADTAQVIIITHSPQVASCGEQHLYISKKTDGVTTVSSVRELTLDERVGEVSRMLAGDKTTEESAAAALRLINEAKETTAARKKAMVAA